jgi:hypothetical protein
MGFPLLVLLWGKSTALPAAALSAAVLVPAHEYAETADIDAHVVDRVESRERALPWRCAIGEQQGCNEEDQPEEDSFPPRAG